MLHNLHIKREGSRERAELKLKSVREYFEEVFPGQSHSVAQLAEVVAPYTMIFPPFVFTLPTHTPQSLCAGMLPALCLPRQNYRITAPHGTMPLNVKL